MEVVVFSCDTENVRGLYPATVNVYCRYSFIDMKGALRC